ncbi:phenylacetate--CoA ligase family protein [Limimaricola pyoseonensis]|uniref:Phenylacetate-CoA ligase n=1 Tax=Limimaricola pyoseonensis TaxID=521013 RepID=A0A1G7DGA7_9RHOB|nr:AMP-binding protein [Limimaricola pyoseonensis]SDE50036.1 phenylacetate-CoA ligase [Limimaricola pyoseonensis]
MAKYYDALETRRGEAREAAQFGALREVIAAAQAGAPYWREALDGVDADTVTDRAALARLPVLRKSDLPERQERVPPFGGLATREAKAFRRLYLSPGPIVEPESDAPHWRFERALHAAGIGAEDVVANCFAYHMTPAGIMFDHACAGVGATVFPAGVGNTDQQVEAIAKLGISAYVGTPDFLRAILEKAEARGVDARGVTKALVTGGPLFPDLRNWYEGRGIAVRQCYGTAELGLISYETVPGEGMVCDEQAIVEIVRPGTGDPVAEGEVGEVVVTTFNPDYPLIRFATGDLSALMPGESPCGRTAPRLKGWMGRADQTTKVRGMFVHPGQVARAVKPYPEVARARLVVRESEGRDTLVLEVESDQQGDGLAQRLGEALRAECRLRGEVVFRAPGSLPNDGKVIDDQRDVGI